LFDVCFFRDATGHGSSRRAQTPTLVPQEEQKKILTKQKFVAEPDIENKGTQNSLFFVNAQRETSFQRDDSVDWLAFNSRGWIKAKGDFRRFLSARKIFCF
jgi:hypothetical protein